MTSAPIISVVMAVYNREAYLAESIASILSQTFADFEFIIVDDGSTDNSTRILRELAAADSRIRPLFLSHRGGPACANAALPLIRGKFYARMDSDDIALPHRFATQLAWIEKHDLEVCGSCAQQFGVSNRLLWFPEAHRDIQSELLFRAGLLHPTVMMLASVIQSHPYNEQVEFDDYELWTRLAPRFRMGNVPQVLLKYRSHGAQIHVVEEERFGRELLHFGRLYAQNLFPNASPQDYATLATLAERAPCHTLSDLENAGRWLVRLADSPDAFLRAQMLKRWLMACQRSSHLGWSSYRAFQKMAPHFNAVPIPDDSRLRLRCALRVRYGSPLQSALKGWKSRAGAKAHAPA